MKYSELKEIAESKNIMLKTICDEVGYTRAGLKPAIDNETIELRKLKILCNTLRISPATFFETGTFGVMINAGGHVQTGNGNKMILESKDREIELLKQRIIDLERIIQLVERSNHGYGNVAEP